LVWEQNPELGEVWRPVLTLKYLQSVPEPTLMRRLPVQ
jgi:hypothetical protein